ncbi:hypothetical protein [Phytoactinopolyspora limicola]|nr:hypothetical protein [Phytoactinopolyspora limicola]
MMDAASKSGGNSREASSEAGFSAQERAAMKERATELKARVGAYGRRRMR